MDLVLTMQGGMTEQVGHALMLEFDYRNIRSGYTTLKLMYLFKEKSDHVVSRISRLEVKKGEEKDDDNERRIIFESIPVHACGGDLQGLSQDWVFPKVTLSGAIMIWYMGFQNRQVPDF